MKFLSLFFKQIKKINFYFLLCIVMLQALGLISLYSAAYGADGEKIFLFKQQIIWLLVGWVVFITICYSKTHFISKTIWPLFLINIFCLILVFFFGKEVYNAKRWLDLIVFHYQPSETLKFILTLVITKKLSQRQFGQALTFKDLLKLSILIVPPVFLIFFQPDLGTAGMILIIVSNIILFNGIERKTLISFILIFSVSIPLCWIFLLKPYQKSRVTSFINPGEDPQGTGYNVIQSKIAIGSGQLLGKGFKQGTQNKLQFLPERHTDFIFSVLSEEYGFLGGSLTLILFFILISFMFRLASHSRDRLSCYFCIGAGVFFLWHVILNLAMTVGLFPVVGIPLPLLSYGGSHTLTSMAFLGLVASVHRKKDLF